MSAPEVIALHMTVATKECLCGLFKLHIVCAVVARELEIDHHKIIGACRFYKRIALVAAIARRGTIMAENDVTRSEVSVRDS